VLIAERTRHQARLRWILVGLGVPEPAPRTLARPDVLARVAGDLAVLPDLSARVGRDLVARIAELTVAVVGLAKEIRDRTMAAAPTLLQLHGCGPLSAAKLVAETAGVSRFRSRAAFANHNGSAPIPVSSGNTVRHRLNRGGNRQLNAALHRIAITQMRAGAGHDYIVKRQAAGDTKLEAIRALKRRISDEVFRRLKADEAARATPTRAAQAAA
jgi:transposase